MSHDQDSHKHDQHSKANAATVDKVLKESEQSFPASDPPSWSGSASSPGRDGEPPPEGEQASWSVERDLGTGLEKDHRPDSEVPPPPEDALQG